MGTTKITAAFYNTAASNSTARFATGLKSFSQARLKSFKTPTASKKAKKPVARIMSVQRLDALPVEQPAGFSQTQLVDDIRNILPFPMMRMREQFKGRDKKEALEDAVRVIRDPMGAPLHKIFYPFEATDPFNGKKVFDTYEAAVLQASMHVRKKMQQKNGSHEYSYEVSCKYADKICTLGKLVMGTNVSTDTQELMRSIPDTTLQSFGHSHPGISLKNFSLFSIEGLALQTSYAFFNSVKFRSGLLSPEDFRLFSVSEPIAGRNRHALFNYDPSKATLISMDENIFPPFREVQSLGAQNNEDPNTMRDFIDSNRLNGKISVANYRIDDAGAHFCATSCKNDDDKYFSEYYPSSPFTSSVHYF